MQDTVLADKIHQMALEHGFDGCGIIPVSDLDGYRQRLEERIKKVPESAKRHSFAEKFVNIREIYPWAKSVVVCTLWLGKYRFPQSLQGKYAKAFLLSADPLPESREHRQKIAFERWMREQGIRIEGGGKDAPTRIIPLRHAAVAAGLGIFRKNNFFYGEKGSFYALEGYLIDRECEYRHSCNLKPCPEKCTLCQKACRTKALFEPYTMNPASCISFWTTFGRGVVPPHLKKEDFDTWICGCDACQDACPHNRHDWSTGEEFHGLAEITELLSPENILKASDRVLCEKVIPRTDFHIPPEQVDTLRVCAARCLQR